MLILFDALGSDPLMIGTKMAMLTSFIFHTQHSAPNGPLLQCPDLAAIIISKAPCTSSTSRFSLDLLASNSSSPNPTTFRAALRNDGATLEVVGTDFARGRGALLFFIPYLGSLSEWIEFYIKEGRPELVPGANAVPDQELVMQTQAYVEITETPWDFKYDPAALLRATEATDPPSQNGAVEQSGSASSVIGAVVGTLVAIATIVVVTILLLRRRARRRNRGLVSTISEDEVSGTARVAKSIGQIVYMQELGKGSSGSVMLATYNGQFVAVKRLLHTDSSSASEALLMASVKTNPNVVKFVAKVEEPTGPALIMEFCPRGSIANHYKKQPLSELDVFKFAYGISSGMASLALAGIVHRDLACRNVLLSEHLHPKVSDFGFATVRERLGSAQTQNDERLLGPIKWQAPEVLRDGAYSEHSDVWAYGCCIIEMLTAKEPYHGFKGTLIDLMAKIQNEAYSPLDHLLMSTATIPEWIAGILRSCFHPKPEQRPQFREIRYNLGKAQRAWKNQVEDEIDEIESFLSTPGAYRSVNSGLSPSRLVPQPSSSPSLSSATELVFTSKILPANAASLDLVNIERLSKLGSGAYGSVYLGQSQGVYVALKVLDAEGYEEEVKREAQVMMKIQPHRNIVQIYGLVSQKGGQLSIVMEFAPRGSLESYVLAQHAAAKSVSEGQMFRWAVGIARGMSSLASSNVVHRDLALRNILLDSSLEPKVSDFGLARAVLDPNQDSRTKTDIGPIRWFAPECFEFTYSEKSDVWAYGCSLLEIVSGRVPFASLKMLQVVSAVKDERRTPLSDLTAEEMAHAPRWLVDIVRKCFAFDAKDRPSFKHIVMQLEEAGTEIEEIKQVEAEIQKRRNQRADTLRARDFEVKRKAIEEI